MGLIVNQQGLVLISIPGTIYLVGTHVPAQIGALGALEPGPRLGGYESLGSHTS